MYLGDSHVVLNTLCWCCHRKIWLHSGEACCHCRTEPPRPWDECPAWAGTPWIDTQRSSSLGMEPTVPSCWEEALNPGNWLLLKSKCYSLLSWIHPQLYIVNIILTLPSPFLVFDIFQKGTVWEAWKRILDIDFCELDDCWLWGAHVRGLKHVPAFSTLLIALVLFQSVFAYCEIVMSNK